MSFLSALAEMRAVADVADATSRQGNDGSNGGQLVVEVNELLVQSSSADAVEAAGGPGSPAGRPGSPPSLVAQAQQQSTCMVAADGGDTPSVDEGWWLVQAGSDPYDPPSGLPVAVAAACTTLHSVSDAAAVGSVVTIVPIPSQVVPSQAAWLRRGFDALLARNLAQCGASLGDVADDAPRDAVGALRSMGAIATKKESQLRLIAAPLHQRGQEVTSTSSRQRTRFGCAASTSTHHKL